MASGKRISEGVREEVRRLRALGLTQKVIARRTRVGQRTVSTILKQQKRKIVMDNLRFLNTSEP